MINSLSFILVFGIFLHGSYGLNITCSGDTLIVSVNATDGLYNHIVSVANEPDCLPTQLTGSGPIQTAELECLSAIEDDPFQLFFVNTSNNILGMMMQSAPTVIDSQCSSPSSMAFSINIVVGTRPDDEPDESVSGVIETNLSMRILQQVTSVGAPNLIIITPGAGDLDTYRMFLDRVRLTSLSGYYDIVSEGCVNPPAGSNYVLFGPPSGEFFLIFTTVIPIGNNGPLRTPEILHVEAFVKLCLIADADDCVEIGGCGNSNRIGRRKREASGKIKEVKVRGLMQVYMSGENIATKVDIVQEEAEAEKQKIIDQESGRVTAPPDDDNQLCANRTLSYVIVAILVTGLVLSFIATIWLTVKVRKTQKITDNTSSHRSLGTTTLKSSSRK